jgi:hypothetical protein
VFELVLALPFADIFASLIAVFVRHVEIALQFVSMSLNGGAYRKHSYEDDGKVSVGLGEHLIRALKSIKDTFDIDFHLLEEFEENLILIC